MEKDELQKILDDHKLWLNAVGGKRADLWGADLRDADLRDADLWGADLRDADLRGVKNIPDYVNYVTSILPDGDIVGWKRTVEGIVKLLIPTGAKKSNATSRKCRAEFAKVLELQNLDGTPFEGDVMHSQFDYHFCYRVGEIVKPTEPFDNDRWNECSTGIHFFITRYEAENY